MSDALTEKIHELLTPTEYVESIYSINLLKLHKRGIRGFLIDLDNTLVSRYDSEPTLKCRMWVKEVRAAGIALCISSNSFYPNRVQSISAALDIPAFFMAMKPFPFSLQTAMKQVLKLPKSAVAVVGDQVFTDVVAGNVLGLYTILVEPLELERSTGKKLVRGLERFVLRHGGAPA